jgi:hypothetical protein
MQVHTIDPHHAFQTRCGNASQAHDLQVRRHNSVGGRFAANASELHGETTALKYSSTSRTIKRFFAVRTLLWGKRFFVRRSADRELLSIGATEKRISQVPVRVTDTSNILRLRKRVRPKGVTQLALRRRLQAVRARDFQLEANQLREEIDKASRLAAEQVEWISTLEEDTTRLESELSRVKARLAEESENLTEKNFVIQALKKRLESTGGGRASRVEVESLLSLVCRPDPPTPLECIELIESTYGDRCIVLRSAKDSARAANLFSYGRHLLDMLRRLVTEYRTKLLEGGDDEARNVFTNNEYAARESKSVRGNKAMRLQRTFKYEGEQIEMFRHLRIGTDDNVAKTIRVHFHWDADRRRIVIGYCGEHFAISSR